MPSQQRLITLIGGGVYDAGGTRLPPELPFPLIYDCKVVASSATALRTALDGLRALRGVEAQLYRVSIADRNRRHWATARLLAVNYDTIAKNSHGLFQPITMEFSVRSLWRGALHGPAWYLDAGNYLDTGLFLDMGDRYALDTTPKTLTITNGGNTPADDVVLTLDAGATQVTGLTITAGSCQLVWSGTVAANKQLVIDCSPLRKSVMNDGVPAWNYLNFGGSHASEAWMRLESGANTMVVTRSGGGADTYLTVGFWDAWE